MTRDFPAALGAIPHSARFDHGGCDLHKMKLFCYHILTRTIVFFASSIPFGIVWIPRTQTWQRYLDVRYRTAVDRMIASLQTVTRGVCYCAAVKQNHSIGKLHWSVAARSH